MTPGEERAIFASFLGSVLAPGLAALGIASAGLADPYDAAWVAAAS
jgi:hypothetical protein